MNKEEHAFDWFCRNCDDHGLVSGKLWKFCPFCGSQLEIKEVPFEVAREQNE